MARITEKINVGKGLSPEELLVALEGYTGALFEILVGDVTRFNLRADYSHDSLTFEAVERRGRSSDYTLSYSYGWEAYWGCSDMNDGSTVSEEIDFIYNDGAATFSREVIEARTTHEEY